MDMRGEYYNKEKRVSYAQSFTCISIMHAELFEFSFPYFVLYNHLQNNAGSWLHPRFLLYPVNDDVTTSFLLGKYCIEIVFSVFVQIY